MTAGRFHLGEVAESFLGQPLLAGLPAVAVGSGAHMVGVIRGGVRPVSFTLPVPQSAAPTTQ